MHEAGTTAALVAVIYIMSRIIEGLWRRHSDKNGISGVKQCLHPEQSRQLREVYEKQLLMERSMDEMKDSNEKIAEAMQQIAECVKKVSENNEKVASIVEKIDRRQEIENEIRRRRSANE